MKQTIPGGLRVRSIRTMVIYNKERIQIIMTMLNFANHILAVAYENNLSISNTQLHKVMYFVMREQKDNYELLSKMYDEPFYIWRYGPVIPKIYRKFRIYGASSIIEKGKRDDNYSVFDESIIKLLNEETSSLIYKSREHTYWLSNKDKIIKGTSDIKYRLEDVLGE